MEIKAGKLRLQSPPNFWMTSRSFLVLDCGRSSKFDSIKSTKHFQRYATKSVSCSK